MTDERIMQSIVEKCDFLYDDALLSDEKIIEKYLLFFAKQFDPSERSISFAFHTGSLCFDVVSVAALVIGCLAYEFSSNDEILAELKLGDMVLYKRGRYHWGGIQKNSSMSSKTQINYIVLHQDAKGKNGPSTLYIPYDNNKHLVKPYFGTSSVTDGRGVRKNKASRSDFISYILGIPSADVPTTLDLSVVIVANKNEFIEICKHLKIRYNGGNTVELTDIVPVSYYTGTGEQLQIGKNTSKAEAVIKVASKISMARDLVLEKHGNKVIGLLVLDTELLMANSTELYDLLRRKTLKFAYVAAPFNPDFCELVMEQYETAKMFACTKGLLSVSNCEVKSANKLTEELNRQIINIQKNETHIVEVLGYWNWEQYRQLKEKVYAIKQSAWSGEDRDNFILSAMALINLFSTAFFNMCRLEDAISSGRINLAVVSPETRITELMEIAKRSAFMSEKCFEVVSILLETYSFLYDNCPKETALFQFLKSHQSDKIALVIPKAYYAEIFADEFRNNFKNVICVTANRFDRQEKYDIIVVTGDYTGKRFDAIQCYAAPEIALFLYDFEAKTFSFRKSKAIKCERKLDARISGLKGEELVQTMDETDEGSLEISESTIREFSDLDEYVNSMGVFDFRRLAMINDGNENEDYTGTAEVKYIGNFTTGEQILFSKFYSAVVLNQNASVVETSPDKLLPGDILVFTKRNDYTSNIVDQIFNQLLSEKKLNSNVQDAAERAFYWKAALKKYKDSNNLTYRAVAKAMKKSGSSLQEVTIRQWLIEESHIIGPRDLKTMKVIAEVTRDPYLMSDPPGYFEACRIVRHYRREILSLIAKAINDKLSNKKPVHGSAFEVVYDNVEKLSETLELENVFELDEIAIVNNGMVNRPISEAEVLL